MNSRVSSFCVKEVIGNFVRSLDTGLCVYDTSEKSFGKRILHLLLPVCVRFVVSKMLMSLHGEMVYPVCSTRHEAYCTIVKRLSTASLARVLFIQLIVLQGYTPPRVFFLFVIFVIISAVASLDCPHFTCVSSG